MDRQCGVEKRRRRFVCKVALSHLKVGVNHVRTSRQKWHLRDVPEIITKVASLTPPKKIKCDTYCR